MKIGIIGVGNIGGPLARMLVQAGHDVRVANSRGPEGVRPFADEVGADAADVRGAVKDVDLVILTIPLPAVANLPDGLFDSLPRSVPVVDTGNYYPGWRDPRIPDIDAGQPESVWVAEQIGRPVIKAFNNILAGSLAEGGQPHGTPGRLAIAVAGDDESSKQLVMSLIDELGFDPVDAGSLADSWRQQPSAPGYCCDYDAETMSRGIAAAVEGAAAAKRDDLSHFIVSSGRKFTRGDLLDLNRSRNPVA